MRFSRELVCQQVEATPNAATSAVDNGVSCRKCCGGVPCKANLRTTEESIEFNCNLRFESLRVK